MKIEQPATIKLDDLVDRCRRATQILVTDETRQQYPNGADAIEAEPIMPALPVTRADATPHILLVGPFQGEPDLRAVAIYVGIGLIEVRDTGHNGTYTFEISPMNGDGIEARDGYLLAAFRLYFNEVQVIQKADA